MSREFTFTWEREVDVMSGDQEGVYHEDCLVTCSLSGTYIPAKLYPIHDSHPPESAALEIVSVEDIDSNDVLEDLSNSDRERILATAADNIPEEGDEYGPGNEDFAYDRMVQRQIDGEG